MYYIGLDPSYAGFGVALCDFSGSWEIELATFKVDLPVKTFRAMHGRCVAQIDAVMDYLVDWVTGKGFEGFSEAVMEIPPPVGAFAAGLYMLDAELFSRLPSASSLIHLVYPSKIRSLKGSKKKPIAKKLIKRFAEENGIYLKRGPLPDSIKWKRPQKDKMQITADESEAALLALYMIHVNKREEIIFPEEVDIKKWNMTTGID
ncbi:hypothetical protein DRO66_02440 [Candidatus Bathyarchaeota archaeon]|nr:MAG: hypothetical protein DRO66_02440 [Candidatus Bathyarchaeota archaeon]